MRKCCEMDNYDCPECQLVKGSWGFEVCGYLVPLREWGEGTEVLPGVQDMACLRAVICGLKLTAEGYCLEWPAQVSLSISYQAPFSLSAALDLTHFLRPASTPLSISSPAAVSDYLWTVALVRRRSLEEIKRIASIKAETRETSLNLLFASGDRAQIQLLPSSSPQPVRGSLCLHFACFDLMAFLSYQSKLPIPDFKCPKCQKPCMSFRFDELFNKLQTLYGPDAIVTVTPGLSNPPSEAKPLKLAKQAAEAVFTFNDFLNSIAYLERVSDSVLYTSPAYTGIESLWQQLTSSNSQCKDHSSSMVEPLGVTIERIDTLIDVDADFESE